MRFMWLTALLTIAPISAPAQPADCPSPPPPGTPGLPLSIDLAGRPGVPPGLTGQVYVQLPTDPAATQDCRPERPPARDVLGGGPGDVLRGPPSPNLLRGPANPHVEVETLPPPR